MCQNKCNQGRWPCPSREACEAEERDHFSLITSLAKSVAIPVVLVLGTHAIVGLALHEDPPEATATVIKATKEE